MTKKFIFLFLSISCFATLIVAQDATLLTVNGKNISKSAFEYIYNKNNSNTDLDKKTVAEYLDMFIAFKLKVAEAEALKLDTVKSFVSELESYRRQLAAPYLTDPKLKEKLVKEEYERMKEDVELSHIFIKLDSKKPNDTISQYNKALDILKKLKKEDFAKVARENSEDPSTKSNGGSLGYLTALRTIYPFETAAYNTPVGSIAGPIRSSFGYHIIKVTGRRPSRGKLLVAHILKSTNDSFPEKNIQAQRDIKVLYKRIKAGEDFGKIAKENSDDKFSAQSNGELPWLETGNVVKEFEDAAYSLKEKGQISEPIKTQFGWHIIKLLDTKSLESFEEVKPEIERIISYGDRAEMISNSFVSKLKKEYNFTVSKKAQSQLQSVADESTDSIFYIKGSKLKDVLYSFSNKIYTQAQLVDYMKTNKLSGSSLESSLKRFSDAEVLAYENSSLDQKYPDFKNLMEEYRDGSLLFNISNALVWEKAMNDTVGLRKFFNQNKANYVWEAPRYKGRVLYCKDNKTASQVKNILKTTPADSIDSQLRKLNKSGNVLKTEQGLYAKGTNKAIDYYVFRLGDFKPASDYPIVFVDGKLLSNPECCDDIKGQVVQDYQAYLDKEWLKQLRAKYPVSINQEVLKTVKKN